jgi:hypothetical protein
LAPALLAGHAPGPLTVDAHGEPGNPASRSRAPPSGQRGKATTLTNDELGFCFEHPSNVTVEQRTDDQGRYTLLLAAPSFQGDPYPGPGFNKEMRMVYDAENANDLKSYAAGNVIPEDVQDEHERTISGIPALEVAFLNPHSGNPQKTVYLHLTKATGSDKAVLSALYDTGEPGTTYKEVFANIISSIHQKKAGESCR